MSLQEKFPEILEFWHPSKNGDLTPDNVRPNSKKKVWWYCPIKCEIGGCVHEWESIIHNYKRHPHCYFCDHYLFCKHENFEYKHPELMKFWHPTKNIIKPTEITHGSNKKIWWICDKNCIHEWETTVHHIISGTRCPYCSRNTNKNVCYHNSIEFKFPEIIEFWHPTKNEDLDPAKISAHSHKKVWCLCPIGCEHGCKHEWQTTINEFSRGSRCPYCCVAAKQICYHGSLEFKRPDIAKEWHSKNELKASEVSVGTEKKYWWICSENHEWCAQVDFRTQKNRGCPICVRKTQKKLYEWLHNNFNELEIKSETYFPWSKSRTSKYYYRFDFIITKMNLIIELDGLQHFKDVWKFSPAEITCELDVYKMKQAIKEEYTIIRILQEDVYYNRNNWEEKLNSAIRMYETPSIVFITNKDEYKEHMKEFEQYITY